MERYRVLAGMVALQEFSVEELARFTSVKRTTVQTVLAREARYIRRGPAQATGKRGGQPIRYTIDPATEEELREEIATLGRIGRTGERAPDKGIPASVVAAEEDLLRLIEGAYHPDERATIVAVATRMFNSGMRGFESKRSEPLVKAHGTLFETLVGLCHFDSRSSPPQVALELWQASTEAQGALHEVGEYKMASSFARAVFRSDLPRMVGSLPKRLSVSAPGVVNLALAALAERASFQPSSCDSVARQLRQDLVAGHRTTSLAPG